MLAYEPVWAIGTGQTATPDQVEETHCFIYEQLSENFGAETASSVPILYGGSVNSSNVVSLGSAKHVSGFLIGGASLEATDFSDIIRLLDGQI